jgi:thiamine biosynthesis protein ThiS
MEITVNGEKQKIEDQVTVAQLLDGLEIDPETVVIERNLEILSREDHGKTLLEEGDSIEIIRMVDGG